jgi:DNA-directed RNA polymerase specialized sigma24 family protein
MVVWQHAGEFRYHSQVSTWILAIAHRVTLKSLLRHKRWLVNSADESQKPFIDPHRELEEQDWLVEGMWRLPYKQPMSLLLTCQLGYSIEQVATLTECAAGTVRHVCFALGADYGIF